jgi:hypothetical protein
MLDLVLQAMGNRLVWLLMRLTGLLVGVMRYVSLHFVAMTDGTELREKFDQVDTGCAGQKEE